MKRFSAFVAEDAPANAAGGGAVAGIGVGPSGEPPRKKKLKILKRLMESEDIKAHKVPFEKNPHIGWYKDKDHIVAYHGTHERNLHSVLKHGLTHKDPKTGHISVAVDPHTAHGYAAMSGSGGEAGFRSAGGGAVNTPHEHRAVVKLHIPKDWAEKHMDHNLGGNVGESRKRMAHKEEYESWKKKNPSAGDHEYYALSELRFNKEIPKHFVKGYMKKKDGGEH